MTFLAIKRICIVSNERSRCFSQFFFHIFRSWLPNFLKDNILNVEPMKVYYKLIWKLNYINTNVVLTTSYYGRTFLKEQMRKRHQFISPDRVVTIVKKLEHVLTAPAKTFGRPKKPFDFRQCWNNQNKIISIRQTS